MSLKKLGYVSMSNKDTVTVCERWGKKSMFKGNEISKMLVNNNTLEIRDWLCRTDRDEWQPMKEQASRKLRELSCVSVSTYTSVYVSLYTHIYLQYMCVCVLAAETCGCPLLQALTRVLKVRLNLH